MDLIVFCVLIYLVTVQGVICDTICITLCDPDGPNGCGSYCCPDYETLVKDLECKEDLVCTDYSESQLECYSSCLFNSGNLALGQICDSDCNKKCQSDDACLEECKISSCKAPTSLYFVVFIGFLLTLIVLRKCFAYCYTDVVKENRPNYSIIRT
ncbi:hypothetical protein SteCoe_16482 [Stentor coeruleus]|uniref:Uncharacterized protein n=1 Tax=Stentor coeruleus TaxID=5963 RepID=A0A1R2C182_9CILI|nr:hypothetical protein SteCoe_16482 [Stentor coeruleus]